MANWKEYTTKTTPEDADEIVIADTKANVNKRTPFSGLWNWIAGKLATAVISQLETQNKSIIPALNELNSNAFPCYKLNADNETHKESFKKWYLSLPEQTFCAVNFNAGWQCMLIGFKSDNEYGTFLRLQYGMEISKFCDILNGEFSFT